MTSKEISSKVKPVTLGFLSLNWNSIMVHLGVSLPQFKVYSKKSTVILTTIIHLWTVMNNSAQE